MTLSSAYLTWNAALADWYFRAERAGRPAYLAVDEDELEAVAASAGITGSEPLDELCTAVRGSLGGPHDPFAPWLEQLDSWRNGYEEPPYVGLLAICVIAASRMEADPAHGIAANDYYKRLNPLIGRAAAVKMPPGFDEVRWLWTDLGEWLDEDLHGSRGASERSPELDALGQG